MIFHVCYWKTSTNRRVLAGVLDFSFWGQQAVLLVMRICPLNPPPIKNRLHTLPLHSSVSPLTSWAVFSDY